MHTSNTPLLDSVVDHMLATGIYTLDTLSDAYAAAERVLWDAILNDVDITDLAIADTSFTELAPGPAH